MWAKVEGNLLLTMLKFSFSLFQSSQGKVEEKTYNFCVHIESKVVNNAN